MPSSGAAARPDGSSPAAARPSHWQATPNFRLIVLQCVGLERVRCPQGDYISVCGQLKWYREELQLRVEMAWVEPDPNAEALWHAEVVERTQRWYREAAAPAATAEGESSPRTARQGATHPVAARGASGGGGGSGAVTIVEDFGASPFVDAVRNWVGGRQGFEFGELLADPDLKAAAESALCQPETQGSGAVPSPTATRVAHLFTRCISVLSGEGRVFLKDAEADTYGWLSLGVIAAALGEVIRAAELRNAEYEEAGVPEAELAEDLSHHPALAAACLTRAQARRHLYAAVEESAVYEASHRRYKLA